MDVTDVSEILLKRGKRVCTSGDVKDIVKGRYLAWLANLVNTRWLMPLRGFKGIYYVRDPEERIRSFLKMDGFAVLSSALNSLFGRNWYFGRVTALSLLGIIHQPVSIYYVLNGRTNRQFNSPVFGKVVLLKTAAKMEDARCGIIAVEQNGVTCNVCSPERNLADYLYLYVHGHADMPRIKNLTGGGFDGKRVRTIILTCYPSHSAKKMLCALEDVTHHRDG